MITITIHTDNAAFQDDGNREHEIARILRDLADRYELEGTHLDAAKLLDVNGNTVGEVRDNGR